MATFGTIASPAPNVLFDLSKIDAAASAERRNQLLIQKSQQDQADHEAIRALGPALAQQDKTALGQLAAINPLAAASLGNAWSLQAQREQEARKLRMQQEILSQPLPGMPGSAPAASSAVPATGGKPFVAANLPEGVDAGTDQIVRTVWGEARGEDPTGQQAVAAVIRNRAGGGDPAGVIFAPNQFEPWNNPQTRAQLEALDPRSPEYQAILANVRPVLNGQAPDPTNGATHFYSPSAQAALGRPAPSWAQGEGQDIGRHRFYRLPAPAPGAVAGAAQQGGMAPPVSGRDMDTPIGGALPAGNDAAPVARPTAPDPNALRARAGQLRAAGADGAAGSLERQAEAIERARERQEAADSQRQWQAQQTADRRAWQEQQTQAARDARVPPGYRWSQDGASLEMIPGGPADPAVQQRGAEARGAAKPARPLADGTRNTLVGDSGRLSELERLGSSFQNDFGGYRMGALGDMANAIARNTPGESPRADWWSGYQSLKNQVRNQLFGAALTATEAAEFEKADINPGMSPEAIRKNLQRQGEIVRGALGRRARSLVADGYGKEAIEQATGFSLGDLHGPNDAAPANAGKPGNNGKIDTVPNPLGGGSAPSGVPPLPPGFKVVQ